MHAKAKMALWLGFAGSILFTIIGGFILAGIASLVGYGFFISDLINAVFVAVVLVPSILFAPVGLGMLFATWLLRRLDPPGESETGDAEGYYCLQCLYDLRGTPDATSCPECGTLVDKVMRRPGFNYGISSAWRVTWMSVLFSSIGTGVGWLIMVAIWLIFGGLR